MGGKTADESGDSTNKRSSFRKWLLRLFLFSFVSLVTLAFLTNGPIARFAIKHYANEELGNLGLEGDFKIKGTLLSGFTISQFNYSGDTGLQAINIESLKIHYSFEELKRSKIQSLHIQGIEADLDLSKFPDTDPKQNDSQANSLDPVLKLIRPWVIQSEISIDRGKVKIDGALEKPITVEWDSLLNEQDSSEIALIGWRAESCKYHVVKNTTRIKWELDKYIIDQLSVNEQCKVINVVVQRDPDWKATGLAKFHGCDLQWGIDDTIFIQTQGGEIDKNDIEEYLPIDHPIDGTLNQLSLNIDQWRDNEIADWEISGELEGTKFTYADYHVEHLKLKFNQSQKKFQIHPELKSEDLTVQLDVDGNWDQQVFGNDLNVAITGKAQGGTAFLQKHFAKNIPETWRAIDLANGDLEFKANATWKNKNIHSLNGAFTIEGLKVDQFPYPTIAAEIKSVTPKEITGALRLGKADAAKLKSKFHWDRTNNSYQGEFHITQQDPTWINHLLAKFNQEVIIESPTDIQWSGSGTIADSLASSKHTGKLKTTSIKAKYQQLDSLQASLAANYAWPEKIEIEHFQGNYTDYDIDLKANWDGSKVALEVAKLTKEQQPVISASGFFPYHADVQTWQQLIAQESPIQLDIEIPESNVKQISSLFPNLPIKSYQGSAGATIHLSDTFNDPEVLCKLQFNQVKGIADDLVDSLNGAISLQSKHDHLSLTGKISEGQEQRLTIDSRIDLKLKDILANTEKAMPLLKQASISGDIESSQLPLQRLAPLVPKLKQMKGTLDASAKLGGTIGDPQYQVNLNAKIPSLKINVGQMEDLKNVTLTATLDNQQKLTGNLRAVINGGDFASTFTADLTDFSKPIFDLQLKASHALVYRDDKLAMRMNADLGLKGTIEQATISGKIEIVESLFYRELELIPFGIPTAAVDPVTLPKFARPDTLNIPAPFDKWKLDIALNLKDPILIRGNLGNGQVEGAVKVAGSLKRPELDGALYLKKLQIELPFSKLTVNNGKILFSPKNGFIPQLDIKGQSRISKYDTNIFIYGSASNPQTTFSSYPPLPENEIMTLMASGVTTSKLEDQRVVASKAFRILLLEASRATKSPMGNSLFTSMMKNLDKFEMEVGETDDFTGRTFSSASLRLHERWHLTAQLDDNKQTRQLIVYSLRFK